MPRFLTTWVTLPGSRPCCGKTKGDLGGGLSILVCVKKDVDLVGQGHCGAGSRRF